MGLDGYELPGQDSKGNWRRRSLALRFDHLTVATARGQVFRSFSKSSAQSVLMDIHMAYGVVSEYYAGYLHFHFHTTLHQADAYAR